MRLVIGQARPPAGEHGHVVPACRERTRDPVGSRVEFGRGRQDEDGALGDDRRTRRRHEATVAGAAVDPWVARVRSE